MSREFRDLEVKGGKGGGMIRGGSSSRMARAAGGIFGGSRSKKLSKYLKDRKPYGKVAAGSRGQRFEGYYEARQGKYR